MGLKLRLAQPYDSSQDQPHAQFLITHLFGMEYAAKYNLGNDVLYTQKYDWQSDTKINLQRFDQFR